MLDPPRDRQGFPEAAGRGDFVGSGQSGGGSARGGAGSRGRTDSAYGVGDGGGSGEGGGASGTGPPALPARGGGRVSAIRSFFPRSRSVSVDYSASSSSPLGIPGSSASSRRNSESEDPRRSSPLGSPGGQRGGGGGTAGDPRQASRPPPRYDPRMGRHCSPLGGSALSPAPRPPSPLLESSFPVSAIQSDPSATAAGGDGVSGRPTNSSVQQLRSNRHLRTHSVDVSSIDFAFHVPDQGGLEAQGAPGAAEGVGARGSAGERAAGPPPKSPSGFRLGFGLGIRPSSSHGGRPNTSHGRLGGGATSARPGSGGSRPGSGGSRLGNAAEGNGGPEQSQGRGGRAHARRASVDFGSMGAGIPASASEPLSPFEAAKASLFASQQRQRAGMGGGMAEGMGGGAGGGVPRRSSVDGSGRAIESPRSAARRGLQYGFGSDNRGMEVRAEARSPIMLGARARHRLSAGSDSVDSGGSESPAFSPEGSVSPHGGALPGSRSTGSAPMGGFAGGMGGALSSWGARRAGINPPRLQVEVHAEEEEGEGEGEEGNVYVVDEEEDEGEEGGSKDALSPLPGAEGERQNRPPTAGKSKSPLKSRIAAVARTLKHGLHSPAAGAMGGIGGRFRGGGGGMGMGGIAGALGGGGGAEAGGAGAGGSRRHRRAISVDFNQAPVFTAASPRGGPAEGAEPEEGDLSLSLSPPHALYASGGADPVFDAMSPRLLTPKGFSTGFGAAAGPGPAGSGLLGSAAPGSGAAAVAGRQLAGQHRRHHSFADQSWAAGGGGWGGAGGGGAIEAAAAAAASAAGSAAAAAGAGQLPLTPGRNRALVAARGGGGGGGALMRGSARERPSPEMDEEDDVWGAAAAVTGGAGGAGGAGGRSAGGIRGLGGGGGGKGAERSGSGAGMGAGRGGMGRMGATATAAAAAGAHAAGGARSSGGGTGSGGRGGVVPACSSLDSAGLDASPLAFLSHGSIPDRPSTASGPSGRLRAAAWGRMRADGGRRDERAAGVGGWEGGDGEGGEEGEGGEREPQQQQWQRRQGRGQAAGGAGGGGGVGGWGGDIIGSSSSSSDAIATNPASSAAANASTGGGGGSSSSGDSGSARRNLRRNMSTNCLIAAGKGAGAGAGGGGMGGGAAGQAGGISGESTGLDNQAQGHAGQRGEGVRRAGSVGGVGGEGPGGGEGMREGGGGGVGDGMRVERRNTVDPHAEQFLKSLSQYISRGLTGELGPYGGEGEGEKGDAEADMWQAKSLSQYISRGLTGELGPYGGEGEGEKGDAEADMWQAQGEDPESGHQPGLTGELGPYGGEGEGEKGDAEADMWQVMSSGSMRWRDFILRMPYDDVKKFYSVSATKIGSGRYGVIRTCLSRKTRVVLACKTIRKDQVKCMEDAEDVRTEVIILGMLRNHPGIISLHDAFEDAKYVHLIMEMCRGGDLFDRVKLRGQFKETDAAIVCRSLVEALLHCHSNGVIHRDVKPENVLMCDKDVDTKIKLIDFGVATFYKRGVPCTERAGTVEYTAPEVLDKSYGPECDIWSAGTVEYTAPEVLDKSYGPECDIWSAGVVLYILLCGFPPFWAATNAELEQSVRAAAVDFRHPRWAAVSDGAKDLVKRMLTKDVRRRISALEIFGGSGGEGCGLVVCERVVV
ncbi:unnamed protein product [Closterium sp. Naga37s-1]|nr:unnamed protein product [Closterium sp. Naga37s-1]